VERGNCTRVEYKKRERLHAYRPTTANSSAICLVPVSAAAFRRCGHLASPPHVGNASPSDENKRLDMTKPNRDAAFGRLAIDRLCKSAASRSRAPLRRGIWGVASADAAALRRRHRPAPAPQRRVTSLVLAHRSAPSAWSRRRRSRIRLAAILGARIVVVTFASGIICDIRDDDFAAVDERVAACHRQVTNDDSRRCTPITAEPPHHFGAWLPSSIRNLTWLSRVIRSAAVLAPSAAVRFVGSVSLLSDGSPRHIVRPNAVLP